MKDIIERENNESFNSDFENVNINIEGYENGNVAENLLHRENDEKERASEKYMPIGSVVTTNDDESLKMIIGYNYKAEDEDDIKDYLACEFPFGVDDEHNYFIFNHNDITRIYHIGYFNDFQRSYTDELKKQR